MRWLTEQLTVHITEDPPRSGRHAFVGARNEHSRELPSAKQRVYAGRGYANRGCCCRVLCSPAIFWSLGHMALTAHQPARGDPPQPDDDFVAVVFSAPIAIRLLLRPTIWRLCGSRATAGVRLAKSRNASSKVSARRLFPTSKTRQPRPFGVLNALRTRC